MSDDLFRLEISNPHGNVDVRRGCPAGYEWVKGKRLQPLCRRHSILHSEAMTGYKSVGRGRWRRWVADLDGVVVHEEDAEVLNLLIAEQQSRTQKKPLRERRQAQQRLKACLDQAEPRLRQRIDARIWQQVQSHMRERQQQREQELRERGRERDRLDLARIRVNWIKEGF